MWIVRLALRRPYTFVVTSLLVAILGIFMILTYIPTDIFPVVDIPVISVAFNYTGMSPDDMNSRIVTPYERILTTTVNDIEHIESQSLYGIGVIKIYFQPNAQIENANAQVTAVSQTAIRQMPTGTQPPLVTEYNASNVPILQLSVGSDSVPEARLFDLATQTMRPRLITVPGVQLPWPYGGKQRQIVVDLDPNKLYAYGISPNDVSVAVNNQSVILPAGTTKIGKQEYQVKLNSSPLTVAELNDLPIKSVKGTTVYIHDVASVRDGFIPQTNIVEVNGKRGVLLSILKSGKASTLQVVDAVKATMPDLQALVDASSKEPGALKITPLLDQSVFVRASVVGVVKEALIAAGLTAMMILLFLGSWRSTLIVMISIPLSILVSIIILGLMGHTLNVMTLGGMALAVGILVDDATVEIENIHRNLHQRKRLVQAILDGASQIAVPAFVSTICICIVFVPVVFISGAAKYLFTPLALAVVFAMLTSYLLSRTLVPTMVHYLLASEVEMYGGVIDKNDPHAMHALHAKEAREHHQPINPEDEEPIDKLARLFKHPSMKITAIAILAAIVLSVIGVGVAPIKDGFWLPIHQWIAAYASTLIQIVLGCVAVGIAVWLVAKLNLIWRTHHAFNRQFEKFRRAYGGLLAWALSHRGWIVSGFACLVLVSCTLLFAIGQDFFPSVDAGQLRLHVRCPPGTRIEQSEAYYQAAEKVIRKVIPDKEIETLIYNIGIPNSSINLSLSDGSLMSPADGEISIALREGHGSTEDYQQQLRSELPKEFPNLKFFFAPADIVTQVLNFGLQAPVDVKIDGPDNLQPRMEEVAAQLSKEIEAVPGVVDMRMQQVSKTPDLRVNVDRTLASQVGVQQRDVASDLLVSLSSSSQTAPNFWLNPQNGVQYTIYVQTPQYWMNTMNALQNTPVVPTSGNPTVENTQLLANLATMGRGTSPTNITHYDIKATRDILLNVAGADLKSTSDAIARILDKHRSEWPAALHVNMIGQVKSMHDSFTALGLGLIFAVVLVYLLLVINFQSWVDPLIILMALPGALAGILWMLWASHTNVSVPALMGAIMSIGVATANSILMITFANDQRLAGMNAHDAALSAGLTRLRPVMMTALAMIIGMLPMSLGLGEGGEQNAPLGRAVIGGLSMATFATLFFVPVVYSLLRVKAPETQVEEELR